MPKTYKGRQILMETLINEGVEYIFGNPGTTESPLLDSLMDYPKLQYIVSLQEAVAVSMADAYAQASGKVGVVNLHVAPGLGNGLGSLYNAGEGRTPLVVTAGQQDTRMRLRDPLLGHDLVAMAKPLSKWSVQAESADELPALLNRAFKVARDTPSGPVFVSLPINVLEQDTANLPLAPAHLFPRTAPDPAGIEEAAGLLLSAKHPLIVCGDGVARSGAQGELVALAELLGAPVMGEVLPARMNFPTKHPHFRDRMVGGDATSLRQAMGNADTVLLVGGEFFEEVWFTPGSALPDGAAVIQIEAAPSVMAYNHPVNVGLVADPKLALAALNTAISKRSNDAFSKRAEEGRKQQAKLKATDWEKQMERVKANWDKRPMSAARLMMELKNALPKNAIVTQEAITSNVDLTRTILFEKGDDFYGPRGGGIGQGLPSAIGVKLANPQRPVICLSGDGSSLYTIQALWSAAHHNLPIVFIILNNRVYRILKLNMNRYRSNFGVGGERPHPHMDLTNPTMQYVDIARGFGVDGKRIEDPAEIGPSIQAALASGKPVLLDIVIDGTV